MGLDGAVHWATLMTSRKDRYRQLAQGCHKLASTLPVGASGRTSLLEMAEVWERLARDVDHTIQQQQQVQPDQLRDSTRSTGQLILKRASTSRLSGQWKDDDFDVLADGAVVGRILKANAAPVGSPWMWMWALAFGHHEDRTPTHGYAESREAAVAAFAKSWRRE
jgi:hypothetical protein